MAHAPQTPPRQTTSRLARADHPTPRSPGGSSLRHPVVRPDQTGVGRPTGTRTTSDESNAIKRKVLGGTIGRPASTLRPAMRAASPAPASPRRQASTPLRTDDAKTNLPSPRHTPSRVSLKDQIAAKRRALQEEERKKKASTGSEASSADDESLLQESFVELSLAGADRPISSLSSDCRDEPSEDVFGRSIKAIIRKAMTTGRLNVCSMELEQLPEQLYTKVLGMPAHELSRGSGMATPRGPRDAFGQVLEDDDLDIPSYEIEDLTQLKASSNMIREIDAEIGFFGALRVLDLKDNQLFDLPSTVANLLNLTHLDLSRNKLKQIPKAVLLLPRLSNLDISHNNLSAVNFSSPLRCTHRSDETNSFLAAFPSTPTRAPLPEDPNEILPSLRSFSLAGNQIKGAGMPTSWPRLLQHLDLGCNALLGSIELGPMSKLQKLERLALNGNGIIRGSGQKETDSFPALKYLDLKGNEIKQIEWIKAILSARPAQFRGAAEWETSAASVTSENAVEVVLTSNPLASATIAALKQSKAEQLASTSTVDHDDFVVIEPVRRRLFGNTDVSQREGDFVQETAGQRRAREAAAARAGSSPADTVTAPTSPALSTFWNERQGALEFPAIATSSMLDADGCLDLAKQFSEYGVDGKVVSLTFQPCLALKAMAFPTEPLALLASVTTLSITYTALGQRPDLLSEIHRCFPLLQHLDLSGSLLENIEGVSTLLSAGLKTLRLKDGKLNDLTALNDVADSVRTESWKGLMLLEELDVRDNEIDKLEPSFGFLPLKRFLVDGNAFRIPARRVYEKGTPELLRWLRDRVA